MPQDSSKASSALSLMQRHEAHEEEKSGKWVMGRCCQMARFVLEAWLRFSVSAGAHISAWWRTWKRGTHIHGGGAAKGPGLSAVLSSVYCYCCHAWLAHDQRLTCQCRPFLLSTLFLAVCPMALLLKIPRLRRFQHYNARMKDSPRSSQNSRDSQSGCLCRKFVGCL
jgi:hypothetical protein